MTPDPVEILLSGQKIKRTRHPIWGCFHRLPMLQSNHLIRPRVTR